MGCGMSTAQVKGFASMAMSNMNQQEREFATKAQDAVPGEVRMFSGCKDSQTSADVYDVSSFGLPPIDSAESAGGACTNAMLASLKENPSLTYGHLLLEMQKVLKQRKYSQIPQLSSSRQVLLKKEPFSLINPDGAQKRTRALLIGINYVGQKGELKGCVNDVKMMRDFVISQGFSQDQSCMRVLTDDPDGFGDGKPTKQAVFEAMEWLTDGVKAGDSLFFHYSGHGGQMKDDDEDERDGMDETLIPMDYATEGQIRDDAIFQQLVAPLPKDAQLVAVFDCCHSGTILDLPYTFAADGNGVEALGSSGNDDSMAMGQNGDFNVQAVLGLVQKFRSNGGKVPWADVAKTGVGAASKFFIKT